MIRLVVNGLPAPQGSKTRMPNGAMVEASSATGRANLKAWRDAVRAACRDHLHRHPAPPINEPVSVYLTFRFPPVKSDPYRHYHCTAPDLSKLVRSTEDAMVQGGLLADDRLICDLSAIKQYAGDGEAVGCDIVVWSNAAIEEEAREARKARAANARKAAKGGGGPA